MTLPPDKWEEHRTVLFQYSLRTIHPHFQGHILPVQGRLLPLNLRPEISQIRLALIQGSLTVQSDVVLIQALEEESGANHPDGAVPIQVLTVPVVVRQLFQFHLP